MHRSFASGKPEAIEAVATIADSLGAPHAAPYSFGLCQRYVDDLVKVTDDELRWAMKLLFEDAKLAVEPAGAAAAAALFGPLADRLAGRRVGRAFASHLAASPEGQKPPRWTSRTRDRARRRE